MAGQLAQGRRQAGQVQELPLTRPPGDPSATFPHPPGGVRDPLCGTSPFCTWWKHAQAGAEMGWEGEAQPGRDTRS